MGTNLTDVVQARLSNFTVGLVYKERGARDYSVLGSGVLVNIEGRHGILTCGHVAANYKGDLELVFFFKAQQRILVVRGHHTRIFHSGNSFEEAETVADLAFTSLLPEFVSSIEAKGGSFLNMEKNRAKVDAFASSREPCVDAVLGMVAELCEAPSVEGDEITSNLHGGLYTGHLSSREQGLLIFEPQDCDYEKLPKSFEGTSGGGAWRIYYDRDGDNVTLADQMLCGIASFQRHGEKIIACQGWARIDEVVPTVCEMYPPR